MRIPRSVVPGVVSPAVPGHAASRLLALLYQFERTQWLPPEALFAEQARQLRVLFAHAAASVPLYRQRFAAAGVDPEAAVTRQTLERLPIVTRGELAAAGDAVGSTALPASHGKRHEVVGTGPEGEALRLFGTEVTGLFWRTCVMREHLWHHRRMGGKLAAIRRVRAGVAMAPQGLRSNTWGPASGALYPTGPAVLLNVDSPLPAQLDWLLREQPDYLISFPSNLAALARLGLQANVALPRLKQVLTIGEPATPEARALARDAWDVSLKEAYSCDEAGYLAMQCPAHEVLHVQAENVLLEVVDAAGRPCGPGEIGRVVVTSLNNFATPLIRYDLGDLAAFGPRCACGRGLPVIARVPAEA